MPSLYGEYIREKSGDFILETPEGFASYRYLNNGKSVYIIDIYVIPQVRKTGHAAHLVDIITDIAKAKGCKEVLGTVSPSLKGATISMKFQLSLGFELHSATNDAVILKKDI